MIALPVAMAAALAFAHPGGLDKNGCHNERATGAYHCHAGSAGTAPHKKKSTARAAANNAVAPVLCVPPRDASGRIKRDYRQRRAFVEANPCPVTGSRNYRDSCPGYHVDHVIPLACCGADDPSNMKWTPAHENLAKGSRCPWEKTPREKRGSLTPSK